MNPAPRPPALDSWYLTGPTAAGKTQVGIELAQRLSAEIVSLDSMAVYQGMNIGTAKPSAADRARVPHHLLDLVPPTDDFSLSEYIDAAHAVIADIKSRGREVLFVGGTPLYLKSLLRGVYQGPPADWEFRAAIEQELERLPLASLHQRLELIDPLLAAKLHPNDKRRIVRALEVFKLTGKRLSHLQTQFDDGQSAGAVKVFVLSWSREQLHHRIDARVDQMFAADLVDEVRELLHKYGRLSRTAMQAVGYREVIEFLQGPDAEGPACGAISALDEGAAMRSTDDYEPSTRSVQSAPPNDALPQRLHPSPTSLSACIDRVKARTRQFARRQETWFRALSECTFVPMQDDVIARETAERILTLSKEPDSA